MAERGNQVDAGPLVSVGVRREAAGSLELITASREDICGFDYLPLDSPRDTNDFSDASTPPSVNTEMNDQIHAGRDSRHDKRRGNVLSSQQGKGAHLHQSLPSRVRVEGAHSWYSTIKSDQEIEAFRLSDLTDDEATRSHSECLFHQTSKRNLAGAFEIRLPGLHSHDIRQLQLERNRWIST